VCVFLCALVCSCVCLCVLVCSCVFLCVRGRRVFDTAAKGRSLDDVITDFASQISLGVTQGQLGQADVGDIFLTSRQDLRHVRMSLMDLDSFMLQSPIAFSSATTQRRTLVYPRLPLSLYPSLSALDPSLSCILLVCTTPPTHSAAHSVTRFSAHPPTHPVTSSLMFTLTHALTCSPFLLSGS
jgi:hypothetical protein